MKIFVGVHPNELNKFLQGEAVSFHSHLHTSIYICVECEPEEIVIEMKPAEVPKVRRKLESDKLPIRPPASYEPPRATYPEDPRRHDPRRISPCGWPQEDALEIDSLTGAPLE